MTPDETPTDAELQSAYDSVPAHGNQQDVHIAGLRAVLAKWGSPVVAGEHVARWEFRWLNPADNKHIEPSELEWQLVCAKGFRSVESVLHDLQQYRYHDKPVYEVRALYAATPRPTKAQAKQITAQQSYDAGFSNGWDRGVAYVQTQTKAGSVPLTDEWIRSRCSASWIFETAKNWVRITEAAHGIKEGGQHVT